MRYLSIGGDNLTTYGFNRYVANIIIALIIYLAGFTKLIIDFLNKKKTPKKKNKTDKQAVVADASVGEDK